MAETNEPLVDPTIDPPDDTGGGTTEVPDPNAIGIAPKIDPPDDTGGGTAS